MDTTRKIGVEATLRREIANLNKMDNYGGELDPKVPEEWYENRILTTEFLDTVWGQTLKMEYA